MAIHAPKGLSAEARQLWRRLVDDYGLADEAHALVTLELVCRALDRCRQAQGVVDQLGPTYLDRFGTPHLRPETLLERDARVAVFRGLRELSLGGSDPVSRLPRLGTGALN